MKKSSVLILLLFVIPANLLCQTILYHNLRETRTQPFLKSWNIDKEDLIDLHVKETVDSQNRVIEIRLYNGKELYPLSCKVAPIIKYEYKDNTIIAHRFDIDEQYVRNIRCGKGQKTVFYIENGRIVKSIDYIVDFSPFEPDENSSDFYIKYFNEEVSIYKNGVKGNWKYVAGYGYSFKKMNGINPRK